jgi:hypothetical protein
MRSAVIGLVLVAAAVAWRILGWPAGLQAFAVWLFYVVGSVLVDNSFVEGPKRRQWIGAPIAVALLFLPMAITWLIHR